MSLSANFDRVADVDIQGITLRSVTGAYELVIGLMLHVSADKGQTHRISIAGADVTISTKGRRTYRLGFARPQGFVEIRTHDFSSSNSHGLYLTLQPRQIEEIENLRDGGDLNFELNARGQSIDGTDKHQVSDTWRARLARSDWLEQLRQAGAMHVLLIEVPMPLGVDQGHWQNVTESLKSAERHFHNGEYTATVASCRVAIDELGHQLYGRKSWQNEFNAKFCDGRPKMTMEDREGLILSAIRHFAHQAHHGPRDGGRSRYGRSQAKRTLALTAAMVASAREF